MKEETYAILVHGIPTTFNPKNPEHLEDLIASNGDRLSSFSAIRWMNIKSVEEDNKRYSSLIETQPNGASKTRYGIASTKKEPRWADAHLHAASTASSPDTQQRLAPNLPYARTAVKITMLTPAKNEDSLLLSAHRALERRKSLILKPT